MLFSAPRINRFQEHLRSRIRKDASLKAARRASAGAAIGACALLGIQAAINPLHAQMKPPSYVIAMVNVKDEEGYAKEFLSKVLPAIKANGGEYLAGGMDKTTAIGNGSEQPPNRVVIVKFPSIDAVNKWNESADGEKLRAEVGAKYADFKGLWAVEGVEPK
jgi:uncharacterized protein (DUF1330 family)